MPHKRKMPKPPPSASRSEQIRRLKLFNSKVDLFRRGRFFEQISQPGNFGVSFAFDGGDTQPHVTLRQRGADEDAEQALVTALRFFVQEGDYIRLDQIVALYDSLPVENAATDGAHAALDAFNAYMDGPIGFVINGEHPTNRELFEGFMYGGLAHANDNKHPQYERWTNGRYAAFYRFAFQEVAANIVRTAGSFYRLNERTIAMLEAEEGKGIAGSVSGKAIT